MATQDEEFEGKGKREEVIESSKELGRIVLVILGQKFRKGDDNI